MNYFLRLELALALAVRELVTPAELRCVAVLMQGPVGMAELSKRALCSKETVTNSGLVVGIPDTEKRGFKVYKLTKRGYELALKLEMKQKEQSEAVAQLMKIRLLECSRQGCNHILTPAEYDWKEYGYGRTAICPQCGCHAFYNLKPDGQRMTMKDNRDEFDPSLIDPSPRMGWKKAKRLLEAKARILTN